MRFLTPLLALALTVATAQAQTTHTVTCVGFTYSPQDITIQEGDTVLWTNVGPNHTTTEGTGVPGGAWDSGQVSPTFSIIFDAFFLAANPRAGDLYNYYCIPHLMFGMVGTVQVTTSSSPGTAYCMGQGCPCVNDDAGAGCANSSGTGALQSGAGTASLGGDDLVLTTTNVPVNQFGIYFRGPNQVTASFGDGLRCVGGQTVRYPIQNSGASGTMTLGPGIGAPFMAGQSVKFQAWYRNPGGPCGSGFNLSNGYSVTFMP